MYGNVIYAPNRHILLTNFAAFVTRKRLPELLEIKCYGCQYDKPSQTEHTCLEPWEESVQHHFDKVQATPEEFRGDYIKVLDVLGLPYYACEVDVDVEDETVKALLTQNVIPDDLLSLFTEVLNSK